ncbi:MAG: NAD(+) synthase [Gammaproteobacteria bacterium]|nr:NAD(+) synthase [Gammaproteobacteria bacterium]
MTTFSKDSLLIDPKQETERLVAEIPRLVRQMKRGGAVLGVSGGIDSATVLGLVVRALGPDRVVGLTLPERDSDPVSETLAHEVCAKFGINPIREDIRDALEGFGCYRRRDEAIKRVVPAYDAAKGYKAKIVLPPNLLDEDTLNVFSVVVITPDGEEISRQLPPAEFLQIVAASNFKQRTRMSMVYYHAELHNYAVMGTANKNEHDQGFFVKYGDGGVDLRVIGHLYKTQVYQLAEYLGVPESIRSRTPTSDTYSAPCNQEEFFFRLPFKTMDMLWYAMENKVSLSDTAKVMGLTEQQVQRAFDDFTRKFRGTEYLRMAPVYMGEDQ